MTALVKRDVPSHLLLLPDAPDSGDFSKLKQLYGNAINSTLQQIQQSCNESKTGAAVDIAIDFPYFSRHQLEPRAVLYPACQRVVAGIYKLVCVTAAKNGFNVEDSEGIDVRVLLISDEAKPSEIRSEVHFEGIGPAVSISVLSSSARRWETVFYIATERGDRMLDCMKSHREKQLNIEKIQPSSDYLVENTEQHRETSSPPAGQSHHVSVAVGGTWDHIHIGHKLLLTMMAFLLKPHATDDDRTRILTVGVTGDELLKGKKFAEFLEDWYGRQASAAAFLRAVMDFRASPDSAVDTRELAIAGQSNRIVHVSLGPKYLLNLVEIQDGYGPTITDEDISALILSAETRAGGKAVNDKRAEKGWSTLEVFEVDVLDSGEEVQDSKVDDTFQSKLSSTGIRKMLSEKKPKSNI